MADVDPVEGGGGALAPLYRDEAKQESEITNSSIHSQYLVQPIQ